MNPFSAMWARLTKPENGDTFPRRVPFVRMTQAGVPITPETALKNAVTWACIRYLTNAVAQIPWRVYAEEQDGDAILQPKHPVDWLLRKRPNPEMGAFTWRQTMLGNALRYGNGYSEIERDLAGRPVALWPLHSLRVHPKRRRDTGALYYDVIGEGVADHVELEPLDVFHVRGFGDGPVGFNVVEYAAQTIGWAQATELFGASFFGEGMNPGGIVEIPPTIKLDAAALGRLKAQMSDLYRGPTKSSRTAFLDGGMKWTKISVQPNDAQFIDTLQYQVDSVCFVPGTEILTVSGAKPIEEVSVGDQVLTHQGRWRSVKHVMQRDYVGPVVTVEAKGLRPVTSTPNHPFYVQPMAQTRAHRLLEDGPPQWIEAGDLVPECRQKNGRRGRKAFHALTIPRLSEDSVKGIDLADWGDDRTVVDDDTVRTSENHRSTTITRYPELSYEFGWICGLFAADGSTSDLTTVFYIGAHEPEVTDFLVKSIAEVFGIKVSAKRVPANNVDRTDIYHQVLARFFGDFGHHAHEKRLPDWCMQANAEFKLGLVDGLVGGDGCIYEARTLLRTTSPCLAWQTRVLLWATGINSTMQTTAAGVWTINGRTGDSREIHTVEWRHDAERRGTMGKSDSQVYFNLMRADTSTYSGPVYNLEVDEDESYVTIGGATHNCRWFGVPPHKVMHLMRATFSNIEHQSIEVVTDSVVPWVRAFEDEADYKLFGQNRLSLFTRMDLSALLRGDMPSQAAYFKSLRDAGVYSVNEIRAKLGENRIGPEGDKRVAQVNLTTLEKLGEGPPPGGGAAQTPAGDPQSGANDPPGDGEDPQSGGPMNIVRFGG